MNRIKTYICFLVLVAANFGFAPSPPTEKVYMVIDISIRDNELYSRYVKQVPPIIKKYGGKYLIRGGKVTSIAGNWNPERIIVIEFTSMQHLQKCFQSPEYAQIAPLRKQSTVSKAIVVNGVDHTEIR